MAEILVRGQLVALDDADVKVRHESTTQFKALGRRTETRAVTWHWTGGEGGGEQVFRVLTERGLSVHFLVDQDGVIWQYADADAYCAHAGGANGFSVGVEISNRANTEREHKRWPRELERLTIHGRTADHTAFYPAQTRAACALARALERAYGLPRAAPTSTTVLSPAELKAWRGHIGHYHLKTSKRDPGPKLLAEIVK